jgi:hypothetical protein
MGKKKIITDEAAEEAAKTRSLKHVLARNAEVRGAQRTWKDIGQYFEQRRLKELKTHGFAKGAVKPVEMKEQTEEIIARLTAEDKEEAMHKLAPYSKFYVDIKLVNDSMKDAKHYGEEDSVYANREFVQAIERRLSEAYDALGELSEISGKVNEAKVVEKTNTAFPHAEGGYVALSPHDKATKYALLGKIAKTCLKKIYHAVRKKGDEEIPDNKMALFYNDAAGILNIADDCEKSRQELGTRYGVGHYKYKGK